MCTAVFPGTADGPGIEQSSLMAVVGAKIGKVGLGKALSNVIEKSGGVQRVRRMAASTVDTVGDHIKAIRDNNGDQLLSVKVKMEYKKRRLLT